MAGPWEKYQQAQTPAAGPWQKYQQPAAPKAPPSEVATRAARITALPLTAPAELMGAFMNNSATDNTYVGQQANRGLADAIGAPVDLLTAGLNLSAFGVDKAAELLGGNFDYQIKDPVMGSDWIANKTADAYQALGGTVVPPEAVSKPVRLTGAAARGMAGAMLPGMNLASAPGQTAGMVSRIAAPYAQNPGAVLARDAIAGAGAGIGQELYDETTPSWLQDSSFSPFAKTFASLIGGLAGGVGAGGVLKAVDGAQNALRSKTDPSGFTSPQNGLPFDRKTMDEAARIAQAIPENLPQTMANVEDATKEFSQFARPNEMPTVGQMADDIGQAIQENKLRVQDPQRFEVRDTNRRARADELLGQTAPKGADSGAFTAEATRQYDDTLRAAREAEQAALDKQTTFKTDLQKQNADLEAARANQPQVSTAMANDFESARAAARQQKNALYEAADPKTPVQGGLLDEALNRIDAGMSEAEKMVRGPYSEIAGRVRALVNETGPDGETVVRDITYGDVKALRAQVSQARKSAVTASGQSVAGSGADVERLDDLSKVLNRIADEINPDAAKFYREEYAPRFKQGRAGEYGAQVDRATRTGGESSATRPSEFGGKFLSRPEDAASLNRAMTPLDNGAQTSLPPPGGTTAQPAKRGVDPITAQNAKEWMLGDLAKSGVLTDNAEIRYDRFKKWADKNRATINQFPDLAKTVDGELARAQQGGMLSKTLANEVAQARQNLKVTEQELRRSALQAAIGNNPENAVASIMGSGDPQTRMAEMVQRLKGNKDATDGLKAAVRDWIRSRAETTTPLLGRPDASRLAPGAMEKLFTKHERTLARIYSPEEMSALRQSHKLLMAETNLRTMASSGSNTVDKMMAQAKTVGDQRKKITEAAFKLKYGTLVGGSLNRTFNLAMSALPNNDKAIEDVLYAMQFDPELAMHLWTRPVKELGTKTWNAKLNTLLAAAAGARESNQGDQ